MKRLYILLVFCLTVLMLQACSEPTKEDVLQDLEQKQTDLVSYHADVMMEISTGESSQVYDIDLSHKSEDFYRVVMKNDQSEEDQIILKNDEGVFVITPALDKQFRFQSDWPDNLSQPYLYSSLIDDVVNDDQLEFEIEEDRYRFFVKTNYKQNDQLKNQVVYFDKKTLAPLSVHVYDQSDNQVVNVTFESFETDVEFESDYFNIELNESTDSQMTDEDQTILDELSVHYPLNTLGSELVEETWFENDGKDRVMLRYSGLHDFTLVQDLSPESTDTSYATAVSGDFIHLESQVGVLTDHSLTWTDSGIDYYLSSETLTPIEMVQVAESLQVSMEK